ncbi:hypothetical protein GJ688_17700 [Heliobacillus mobilis]|uniref:Helix-turn-helix domain-containing protein n=1 Tax=Heliobacterium mobile TaxID=28064 RepID=A0A6I3SPF4_HELMO|nr:helix-turn-helix domain-containing protein [Heliobacterium mobile]MTV50769.1 hypothetical protein [Heliobacterium mobile]
MLAVEMERSFDIIDKKWDHEIYVKMYRSAVTSGLMAELGPERWAVLCVIASYMDEQGNCFPSQDAVAAGLRWSRQTANKWINSLVQFRWKGQQVIERVYERKQGRFDASHYTILPLSQLAIFNGEVTPTNNPADEEITMSNSAFHVKDHSVTVSNSAIDRVKDRNPTVSKVFDTNKNQINQNQYNKKETRERAEVRAVEKTENNQTDLSHPKSVIQYFCQKYREKYTVNYNPNWKRDMGLVKTKLLSNYSPVQIQSMIDTVFSEYDTRWKKDAYPRPSIGQLATWLSNEALALVEEQKPAESTEPVRKHGGRSVDEILARLRRGGEEE